MAVSGWGGGHGISATGDRGIRMPGFCCGFPFAVSSCPRCSGGPSPGPAPALDLAGILVDRILREGLVARHDDVPVRLRALPHGFESRALLHQHVTPRL